MAHPVTPIQIEHHPAVHCIEPSQETDAEPLTLLELVEAVSEVTENEHEVVATVGWMIRSGRIRLIGTFRDTPRELFG